MAMRRSPGALLSADEIATYCTGSASTDANRAQMMDLASWSQAVVRQYAPDAPEEIQRSAVLRLAYYDWHSRLSRRPGDGGMLGARRRHQSTSPLRESGAMAILSGWKQRGVGVAGPASTTTTTSTGAGLTAADVDRRIRAALAALPAPDPAPSGLTDQEVDDRIAQAIAALPAPSGLTLALTDRIEWSRRIDSADVNRLYETTIPVPTQISVLGARFGRHYADDVLPPSFWTEITTTAAIDGEEATAANSRYLSLGVQGSLILGRSTSGMVCAGSTHGGATLRLRRYLIGHTT